MSRESEPLVAARISDTALTTVVDSLRAEFTAGLTTAGVQIGAVEKSLGAKIDAKIGSLRLWGVLALVGGQTGAALVMKYTGPAQVTHAALRFLVGL